MRTFLISTSLAAAMLCALAMPAISQTGDQTQPAAEPAAAADNAIIIIGGREAWTPGTGALKGTMVAVMSGDPSKAGQYVMRIKVPPNTTIGAHYHGDAENVTVVSGTFYVGLGDKVDKTKVTALKAGSFAHLNAGVKHYALTKADGAVLEVTGTGPSTMTMVDEKM